MRTLRIGLTETERTGSIEELNVALANESLLLIKTKKVLWDIVGPQFLTLKELLNAQTQTLSVAIDGIAERIRTLGGYPIGTAAGFLALTELKEHPGRVLDATAAIEMLLDDHEALIRLHRRLVDRCERTHHDRGSADFAVRLLEQHEQMAWILRSFIEGAAVRPDGQVKLPASATPSMA